MSKQRKSCGKASQRPLHSAIERDRDHVDCAVTWRSADQPPGVYTVKDGNKVDDKTLEGWKTWRAMACERCHGPEQEGLVGPSLVNSLKVLSKDDFHTTIKNGRPEKGMPNFGGVDLVQKTGKISTTI